MPDAAVDHAPPEHDDKSKIEEAHEGTEGVAKGAESLEKIYKNLYEWWANPSDLQHDPPAPVGVSAAPPATAPTSEAPASEPAPAAEPAPQTPNLTRAKAMGDYMLHRGTEERSTWEEGERDREMGLGAVDEDNYYTDGTPEPIAQTPEEERFFARGRNPDVIANTQVAEDPEEIPEAEGGEVSALGAIAGGLGLAAGGLQTAHGVEEFRKGTEAGHVQGGVDIAAGGANVVAGGTALAEGLGLAAEANPVTAAVAGVATVESAGEHRGAEIGAFGRDAEGNKQGAFEAAWNKGSSLWDGSVVGGIESVGATVGLEAGALLANLGLGEEGMGSKSHLFGTAKNVDGDGTHEMGASEAVDHAAASAGVGLDHALGIDPHSTKGAALAGTTSGVIEAAAHTTIPMLGMDAVTVANGVGAGLGNLEGAVHYLGGLFGGDDDQKGGD